MNKYEISKSRYERSDFEYYRRDPQPWIPFEDEQNNNLGDIIVVALTVVILLGLGIWRVVA